MIDKLLFLYVMVALAVLCWACSGSVDVHGVPDQIELTGCTGFAPSVDAGKDVSHD